MTEDNIRHFRLRGQGYDSSITGGEADARLRLKDSGGDGTSGGMEARLAKLEAISEGVARDLADIKADVRGLRADAKTDVGGLRSDLKVDVAALRSEARTDFRLLFGALIAVALGLSGLLAKGFNWL